MKNVLKALILSLSLIVVFGLSEVQAQKISLVANIGSFDNDIVTSSGNVNYTGSVSGSLNFRYFTRKKWAWRIGAGVNDLEYTASGLNIATNYSARRQDLTGIIGVEKHFNLAMFDIYPGIYVPITIVGDDIIANNAQSIRNGDMVAGLGVVLGGQLKLLKILRVGLEFNATYRDFQTAVGRSIDSRSFVPFNGLQYNTNFTVGVAL
ncbi:MAG: hypothetical protein AAF206_03175 [Bacteroidota bacterium]